MAAHDDPRMTIKTIVDAWMGLNIPSKDNIAVPCTYISLWESGPERMKYLFYTLNFDFVMTFGNPETRSTRPIQDVPVH